MTDQNQCEDLAFLGTIPDGEVHVWTVDLDDRTIPLPSVSSVLSPQERERAARFFFEPDAWHFSVCRMTLRLALAIYLGKRATDLAIQTRPLGKPFVEGSQIFFNVSHCRGLALLAFTRIGEIGVDIEGVQQNIEAVEIASEHFTQNEAEWIATAETSSERARRLTRLWTRKEAVLKATGEGISGGLKSFDLRTQGRVSVQLPESWNRAQMSLIVKDVEINESIYAAIAGPNASWIIRRRNSSASRLLSQVKTEDLL